MRLIQPLPEILRPPLERSIDIAPLLERPQPAEKPPPTLLRHKRHLHLARSRIHHLAFNRHPAHAQPRYQQPRPQRSRPIHRRLLRSRRHHLPLVAAPLHVRTCESHPHHPRPTLSLGISNPVPRGVAPYIAASSAPDAT